MGSCFCWAQVICGSYHVTGGTCFWWRGVVVLSKSLHPDHCKGGEGPVHHVMFWRKEKEGMANLDVGFHRNQLPYFSALAVTQGEHLPCPPQLRTSIVSKCPLAAQMPGDAHC